MTLLDRINQGLKPSPFAKQAQKILNTDNPFSRFNAMGHVTGSGLVVRDKQVPLICHPYIKQWLQPGGHIDDGESPLDAAIREVFEETGLICISDTAHSNPIDIDAHKIPANPRKNEGAH